MPHLNALRAVSTSARVNSSYDAVTAPAIRAAFTGKDQVKVFAFMANFVKGRDNVPSLFTQLKAAGIKSAVYSDATFSQFGNDITTFRSNEMGADPDEIVNQNAALFHAVDDYLAGHHDLVLAHITYSDHVAHEVGINSPRYEQTFTGVDQLIAGLHKRIPASENLVVFGDHGHTPEGRHGIAMDVPTFALFRGPGYCRGCDLGTISITDYRYLLGWGLKVPLAADYQSGRHPEALVGNAPLPSAYAEKMDAVEAAKSLSWGVRSDKRHLLYGVLLVMGALFSLILRRLRPGLSLKWLVVAGLCPLLMACWGEFLALIRPEVHFPTYARITGYWVAAFLGGLVIMKRWNKEVAVWVLLGVPLLLLYPTSYRYGWPAIMAPVTLCWLLFECTHHFREKTLDLYTGLALSGAAFFLLPYTLVNAESFHFESWQGPLTPSSVTHVLALSAVAKLVVFGRRQLNALSWVAAVGCALVLLGIQVGIIDLDPGAKLVFALVALVSVWVAEKRGVSDSMRPLLRIFAIFGVWLLFLCVIRVSVQAYFTADCLLAALTLAARAIPDNASKSTRLSHAAFLGVVGLIAAGWIQFSWGVGQLEWHFLYDFLDGALVEREAAWFVPVILIRYALVVVLFLLVIGSELPHEARAAHPWVFGIVGLKVVTLVALTMGLGAHHASSGVYLEGVQQTGVLLCLGLGLFFIRTPLRWVSVQN